jgi:alkanesulfonate monooxygenase SsuD/methylene tetrahydromethanopterin reductase-like flavin-dependent oxidoreductase (luciferase family)
MDFGLGALPATPGDRSHLDRWRTVLDRLPDAFSTIWLDDHLQNGERQVREGWTMLTYLAALHRRFRFGHMVVSQSFRNPALLAKMAATLQELTEGRYILGLGAGWREEEYRAYGYAYPSGGERVAQLAEAIEVIRALWTQSPATYRGTHYQVENAYCEPRPDPAPPILIGTNGPRALKVVARLADWWNWDAPLEMTYRAPMEVLRRECEAIGRPFDEISLTATLAIWMPDDPSTFEATYTHSFYPGQTFAVAGPEPEDVAREIERLVDVGVRHVQVTLDDMAQLQRFTDDVLPHVRLEQKP